MDTTVEEALVQRELVAAMSQTASTEETGSQSSGVQMPAVGSASGDVLGGAIEKLRRARAELAADRKRVNKELKKCREASTPIEDTRAESIHGRSRSCNADACSAEKARPYKEV